MNATEKNTYVKSLVADKLNPETLEGTIQIGTFEYAVPVAVEGEVRYCVVAFTAKKPSFNADEAGADYISAVEAREAREAELAEKRAAKEALAAEKAEKETETNTD